MGAKFFGQRFGNLIQFHGYSSPEDPEDEGKDKKFGKLILEYFNEKLK